MTAEVFVVVSWIRHCTYKLKRDDNSDKIVTLERIGRGIVGSVVDVYRRGFVLLAFF